MPAKTGLFVQESVRERFATLVLGLKITKCFVLGENRTEDKNRCSSTISCSSSFHVFFRIGSTVVIWPLRLVSLLARGSMSPLMAFRTCGLGET